MTAKKSFFSFLALLSLFLITALALAACHAPSQETPAVGQAEEAFEIQELRVANGTKEIYGKLYLPAGKRENLPAIILSHSAGLNADSMHSYCEGFAERGFVAYAFDFCGGSSNSRSDGSEKDMTIFTELEDLKAVIGQIKDLPYVDAGRLYLFGTSQGGLVSALAANDSPEEIAGLILLYPAFNIPEMAQNKDNGEYWLHLFGSINWRDVIGSIDWSKINRGGFHLSFPKATTGEAFIRALEGFDVYKNIGSFTGNVLILHGTCDLIVNKSYSERAQDVYENCELYLIPGATHGFNGENYSFSDYDKEAWEYIDAYLAAEAVHHNT